MVRRQARVAQSCPDRRSLSLSAEDGCEFKREVDAEATQFDLPEPDVSRWQFHIGRDEQRKAVADAGFYPGGQIDG